MGGRDSEQHSPSPPGQKKKKKKKKLARPDIKSHVWWHTPVIPAMWEAIGRRIKI
jgi:hypothetical protein